MRQAAGVALIFGLLTAFPAVTPAGVGGSAKVGTLGLGGDLTLEVSRRTNLRIGVNMFNTELDFSDDDEDGNSSGDEIVVGIDFQTICGFLDWHPEAGGFRLSAGVILNNNEVNMTADLTESVEINNVDYSISDFRGNADFRSLAPYIGLGWGNAVDKKGRWTLTFDLGVMFQGAPNVTIEATASDPLLQMLLDEDIQKEIDKQQDNLDLLSIWPVMSFGVGFRFF